MSLTRVCVCVCVCVRARAFDSVCCSRRVHEKIDTGKRAKSACELCMRRGAFRLPAFRLSHARPPRAAPLVLHVSKASVPRSPHVCSLGRLRRSSAAVDLLQQYRSRAETRPVRLRSSCSGSRILHQVSSIEQSRRLFTSRVEHSSEERESHPRSLASKLSSAD